MLDIDRLSRIRFAPIPRFQQIFATAMLAPQYRIYPRLKIRIEGAEHLPRGRGAFFAMNHTDRYNYFPFQYALWKRHQLFTAVWAKGKYYENPVTAGFLERAGMIPTPSKGYVFATDFKQTIGRAPTSDEYHTVRGVLNRLGRGEGGATDAERAMLPPQILTTQRNMLGVHFDPAGMDYFATLRQVFRQMMELFVQLNNQALDVNLNILVFPQGTRSIRLSRGHIGLAEMALHLDRPIIPIGCNGSDLVHPGNSPFIEGGEIVYRVGPPITRKEMEAFRPPEPFVPFTEESDARFGEQFQGLVDLVTDRINELLEPRYQYAPDLESDGVQGTDRFI